MADIAMLVAEEYERRVKQSDGEAIDMFSFVSGFAQRLHNRSAWFELKFGEERLDKLKWVPKTQIGLAAINGFFSA